jgi:hypothetical protein
MYPQKEMTGRIRCGELGGQMLGMPLSVNFSGNFGI